MPLPPSNYASSYDYSSLYKDEMEGSYFRSSFPNSSSSPSTLNYKSYPTSIYSSTSSVPSSYSRTSSIGAEYRPLNHLPPSIPSRRITPIKRSYLNNLDDDVMDRMPIQRRPLLFQTRPLKNLTVLSHSDSKTPIRSVTRSPSPAPSVSYKSSTPRRTFPQVTTTTHLNLDELSAKEESPVIFDANLTFVLGTKGKMKQNFVPVPAHLEDTTASNYLTSKISDFLKRTDHVMDEWKSMGRRRNNDDDDVCSSLRQSCKGRKSLGRSSSATNIMIKGFQLFSRANSSRSSMAREMSEDRTEADGEEVFLTRLIIFLLILLLSQATDLLQHLSYL